MGGEGVLRGLGQLRCPDLWGDMVLPTDVAWFWSQVAQAALYASFDDLARSIGTASAHQAAHYIGIRA